MRSGVLSSLIVVVLCMCATAAAATPTAQVSPGDILITATGDPTALVAGDPNNPWDVAAHLAADWEYVSVSMSSQVYNPAVRPDVETQGPTWSLSVSSLVEILDSEGLIGWSVFPKAAKAYDQNGEVVASMETDSAFVRWYEQPTSWSVSWVEDRFHLSFPVDLNATYPEAFSKVEWSMNVLLVEETKTVDLPFEPNETWVEVTPGFDVMVEEATTEEGNYQYKIQTQRDSTKVGYLIGGSVNLWNDNSLPPAAILSMAILNGEGKTVQEVSSGGYSFSSKSSGGTWSGNGTCSACGDATTIRFTLGFNFYEQEASFTLKDVPVPEF